VPPPQSRLVKLSATLAALAFTLTVAAAQVTVETLGLGLGGERGKAAVPEFHVFGGQPVELDFAVDAPLNAQVSLTANLYQLAKSLAAPLRSGLPVGGRLDFSQQTRQLIHASLPLPEVKRKTEILLRVQAQIEGEPKLLRAGDARLFVYPKDLTKELAGILAQPDRESGAQFAVFGESKRIRAFFQAHEIPFLDCGTELPAEFNKRALYLGEWNGESPLPRIENTAGARLAIFQTEPGALPGVHVSTVRGVSLTKVTLPILDTLATNPQSQQTFADLLLHSLQPRSP